MHRLGGVVLATLVVAGLAAGCGVLLASGPPAALHGVSPLRISFEDTGALLDGAPLDGVVAASSPTDAGAINDMILRIEENFLGEIENNAGVPVERVMGPPGPDETRLVGHLILIERGANGPMGDGSRLVIRFEVYQNGTLVDVAERDATLAPGVTRPSTVQRLTHLATSYGRYAARFYQQEQSR